MKSSNFAFESTLIVITILLALCALFSVDFLFLGALWLIPLGIMQVVHSLVIGANYWKNQKVRISLSVYWAGVVLNFTIMIVDEVVLDQYDLKIFTIVFLPLTLALYLWAITYFHKENPRQNETVPFLEENRSSL